MHPSPPLDRDGPTTDREGPVGAEGAEEVDPDDRVFQPMSLRGPAFIVLGIAVVIVAAGVAASIFGSGPGTQSVVSAVTVPGGTVVHLTPATKALHSIVYAGQPPADILGALDVPADSPVTDTVDIDGGVGQFDRKVEFRTGLVQGQVVSLYRTLLPKLGWKVTYTGSGASTEAQDTEVLARKGSNDSFYWEVGVVVSPTTSAGVTPFAVEVLESPDQD
jgi:hypothetical protein